MYTVHLINLDVRREFDSFEAARAWAIRICFEANIYHCGQSIAYFSPISGLTTHFN